MHRPTKCITAFTCNNNLCSLCCAHKQIDRPIYAHDMRTQQCRILTKMTRQMQLPGTCLRTLGKIARTRYITANRTLLQQVTSVSVSVTVNSSNTLTAAISLTGIELHVSSGVLRITSKITVCYRINKLLIYQYLSSLLSRSYTFLLHVFYC